MLAEALDAEELEHYHTASLYHGKEVAKKWKWASKDKAGTEQLPEVQRRSSDIVNNPMTEVIIKQYLGDIDNDERLRRARDFCRSTGKQIAYRTPDGQIIDGDGKIIEKTPDLFIVPI